MPGDPHEGVIKVLQDDPMTAVWLLGLTDADAHAEACADAETRANSVGSVFTDRLRLEGREEGIEEGRAQAAMEESRGFLVLPLENTQTGIAPGERERIEACTDLGQLKAWIAKF